MSTTTDAVSTRKQVGIVLLLLFGAAVALSIGLYARLHTPTERPVTTLGFSGILQMKAWLTTAAVVFVIVQVVTALWMWGHLPRAADAAYLGACPAPLERVDRVRDYPPRCV